jgi:hypothetical protein
MASTEAVKFLERIYARSDKHTREIIAAQAPPVRVVDVPLLMGASGFALVVDDHVFLRLGLNGPAQIVSWSLGATVAGVATASDCVIDVLAGATLATAATICGGNEPELNAQDELVEQPPTGWTTTLVDPSWLMAIVTSVDGTVEVASLTLRMVVFSR